MTGVTLWLTGDVMTGRGIDQVLPYPGDPRIFESFMTSAFDYVRLAERVTGPIPHPVDFPYVWGDALAWLEHQAPDLRLINLETAVTTSDDVEPKGIQYRMHPANLPVLAAAGVDACVLANNHVLDWGRRGLGETLRVLGEAGVATVGAGRDRVEARDPARFEVPGGRVRLLAFGLPSSGVPIDWAAGESRPGVNVLADLSSAAVSAIAADVARGREPRELVVVSLHWGGNWGYAIPDVHRAFAHRLIDEAGVDLVWGHSPHHPLGIEVYRGKLILYGCGDLINDYEGITGHEAFRDDLALLYFPTLCPTDGRLERLVMVPLQRRHFRLERAPREEAEWLYRMLNREGTPLGIRVRHDGPDRLVLEWHGEQ
ncbi:CapA family protein [Halomonas ventosae]|uniref:Poly-gamma-glutamate synthesis protein (Capsule biosynthesis protein) n=1 Tax=Halomonas ventosae TaxID=229007 RepID=A0A2T0VS25_9GAMM|nr:CapA family protein [Halomonas ventosae]PRY73383.1 poly-gamma-glutamate synthesis protein (capsule biosynthesis protein) [Halomonas ventosae]